MTKIASWNVNSIRVRLPHVIAWLKENPVDVLLLQEIKTTEEFFPQEAFEDVGYNVALSGQKTYNGVAVLSKSPIDIIHTKLPGDDHDEQARYLEVVTGNCQVASVYVPNGQEVGSEKYDYKLNFLDRLYRHMYEILHAGGVSVIGGDYNIAPADLDVYDPESWGDGILCSPDERAAYRKLIAMGYGDAYRTLHPSEQTFSWWDYRGGAYPKNHGLRIDHLLLSPEAQDKLNACVIDVDARSVEKASDHAPIWCELGD